MIECDFAIGNKIIRRESTVVKNCKPESPSIVKIDLKRSQYKICSMIGFKTCLNLLSNFAVFSKILKSQSQQT